jgi:phenolic acid decarboxylase
VVHGAAPVNSGIWTFSWADVMTAVATVTLLQVRELVLGAYILLTRWVVAAPWLVMPTHQRDRCAPPLSRAVW